MMRQAARCPWPSSAPVGRSEECLQYGCDLLLVFVGVTEELSGEEDVVRVELPELFAGDGDLGDP